jgi:hypothetical protein
MHLPAPFTPAPLTLVSLFLGVAFIVSPVGVGAADGVPPVSQAYSLRTGDVVGLYKLRACSKTHSLKPPGFNPCCKVICKVISWFLKPLLSNATCTATPGARRRTTRPRRSTCASPRY